jgi:hypothetical protein
MNGLPTANVDKFFKVRKSEYCCKTGRVVMITIMTGMACHKAIPADF